jgi:hypothetical protein
MTDKIKFLMRSGELMPFEQYQKLRGLRGTQIAKHYNYTEPKFTEDIERYGELIVCDLLMQALDTYRVIKKQPVNINSFNRDDAKQIELKAFGYRTAEFSPHVVKLAADCDTKSKKDTEESAILMRTAGKVLGIKIRIGWKDYLKKGQTFIHVDVCPEFYDRGKVWYERPHPAVWENEITW